MRYFFQLSDGQVLTDDEGEVFDDLDAAKIEAARIAGEWLRDNADEFAQDGTLLVEVLDERRAVLATVAVEASAPTGMVH
ncbi:hypothetical protein [Caulobacter sp. BK020]|uniref:DUF6894 family protein n=1 Tax=Caulobacter sp. BK020 TaxID=2512117 RepID=UPI0010516833|nr:hypothetical protein [Caulobacter sp. BK020]TCS05899.1 hypothetical protein EV278_1279 [Caulobacter sp. BK020]